MTIQNVAANDKQFGIFVTAGSNVQISCTTIHDNSNRGVSFSNSANAVMFDNDISGNSIGVFNGVSDPLVNAENNFWGAADGPSNLGGTGDSYSGNVDADPFLPSLPVCLAPAAVTNTLESGPGSLRQAILDANANPGPDLIDFSINGGGAQTITLSSALPTISEEVTIDGSTQPGFAGTPLIQITGTVNVFSFNGIAGTSVTTISDLDLTSSVATSGTGISTQNSSNIVVDNVDVTNRRTGMLFVNGDGIQVINSDFAGAGIGQNGSAIRVNNVTNFQGSGNTWTEAGVRTLEGVSNFLVTDSLANVGTSTNYLVLEATSGQTNGDGLYVVNSTDVDIENVDLTPFAANTRNGVVTQNSSNIVINNVDVSTRGGGMTFTNGDNIEVTGSDFTDSGLASNSRALYVNGATNFRGYDNTWTRAGVRTLQGVSNFLVTDDLANIGTSTNYLILEASSGQTNGDGLYVVNSTDVNIENVDLTPFTANTRNGIVTQNSSNIVIDNVDVSTRGGGMTFTNGDNIEVTGSDFTDSGLASNSRALYVNGATNFHGSGNTWTRAGVRTLQGVSNFLITDDLANIGTSTNYLLLEATSGQTNGDGLFVVNSTDVDIENVDLTPFAAGTRNGVVTQNSSNIVIDNVDVSNRGGGMVFNAGSNIDLLNSDLTATGQVQNGRMLFINGVTDFTGSGLILAGTGPGVQIANSTTVTISCSQIFDHVRGVDVTGTSSGVVLFDNHIENNTTGVDNNTTTQVNAENNYWGAGGVPSTEGDVDADPVLTSLPVCLAPAAVTNTLDSGPGSLRQAILDANANAGPDVIDFNIGGGGAQTITLLSVLPTITDPVTIDGSFQPIDIDASGVSGTIMTVAANNTTLNDLQISNAAGVAVLFADDADDALIDNLDVSWSGVSRSGTGILFNGLNDRVTVQNVTASHRSTGINVNANFGGFTDITVIGSNLSDTNQALRMQGVSTGALPGGVVVYGNDYSNSSDGVHFRDMQDLVISDGSAAGTNVNLTDGGSLTTVGSHTLTSASGNALHLLNVDDSTVDSVDVSYSGASRSGTGILLNGLSDRVDVQNVTASHRSTGINVNANFGGFTDITVIGSNLSDTNQALRMQGVSTGALPGGVVVYGNDYSNSSEGVHFRDMQDLVISDGSAAGTNVNLTDGGSLTTVGNHTLTSASGTALHLLNVDDSTVDSVDVSYSGASRSGTGILLNGLSDRVDVQNVTGSNRSTGINVNANFGGFTDITVIDSNLSDTNQALRMQGVSTGALPGGVVVYGNDYSNSSEGVHFRDMQDLVISDGSAAGTNVNLTDGGSLTTVGSHTLTSASGNALHFLNVDDSTVDSVDVSYSGASRSGTGILLNGLSDRVDVQNVTGSNRSTGINVNPNFGGFTDITVSCSQLLDNDRGVSTGFTGVVLVDNHFENNTFGVDNNTAVQVNAENNYWGAVDGPSTDGGSGDAYEGDVDADPFLTSVPACLSAPATLTWVGDVDANWNTDNAGDTNWDTDTLPQDGDTLIFPEVTSGTLTTNNNTTAGNSYTLQVGQGNWITGNGITLDLAGVDITRPAPSVGGGSEARISNPLALAIDSEVNVSSGGNSQLWLQGVLSGATGGLTKTGAGEVVVFGNNTYEGSTEINEGKFRITHPNALGSNLTGTTLQAGAQLQFQTSSDVGEPITTAGAGASIILLGIFVPSASYSGTLTLGATTTQINIGRPAEFSGKLTGSGDVRFQGGNVLTFSSMTSDYTGATTIATSGSGAVLLAAPAELPDTTAVTVIGGATLGGTGTVGGSVTVESGGTVAPGADLGILNTGSVDFNSGSNFSVEIGGTTAGNGAEFHDQSNVTGTVSLTGATLVTSSFGGFTPSSGDTYTIVSNDGTEPIVGTFAGLPEGTTISNFLGGGLDATISYAAGSDSNDVVLSVAVLYDFTSTSFASAEGDGTNTTNVVMLTRDDDRSAETVDVVLAAGATNPATPGTDFTAGSITVSFAVGETTKPVPIELLGEMTVELNETIDLSLANFSGSGVAGSTNPTASLMVTNDDSATLTIGDATVTEGDDGTTTLSFPVTLDATVDTNVSVDYETQDLTATTADNDYVGISPASTFTLNAGDTSGAIDITVNGETTFEPDEALTLLMSNLQAGGRDVTFSHIAVWYEDSDQSGSYTPGIDKEFGKIEDANLDGVLSVGDLVTYGPYTPTSFAVGGAQLRDTGSFTDTIATITTDHASSIIFTTATIAVPFELRSNVNGDRIGGADPDFFSHDRFWDRTLGGADFIFDQLSDPFLGPVDTPSPANSTLIQESDDPWFDVEIFTLPSSVTATGTILNDDVPQSLVISDATVAEGDSGITNLIFTVTLSSPSNQPLSVSYATGEGTATGSGSSRDFNQINNGSLTFAAGQTENTIIVEVIGDTESEADETLVVNLSNPSSGVILDGEGTGIIENDDAVPIFISIDDVTQTEGNSGTTAFVFTVSLSDANGNPTTSSDPISVDFATADGTATGAGNVKDFNKIINGSLTIDPGQTSSTITVEVIGDTLAEPDETFLVNLANPINGVILDGQGEASITNEDALPISISINDVTQLEGDSGTTLFVFTVTLSEPSAETLTVEYQTADGTATHTGQGQDYTQIGVSTLTFAPNETTQTITVEVVGDVTSEADETFFVDLSNPSTGVIVDSQGVGTIQNDDSPPIFVSIDDVTMNEGDNGTTVFEFTVTLSEASSTSITVDYDTFNGTATRSGKNKDYERSRGTLTFAAGQTTQTITVVVNGDTTVEPNETFFVRLSNAVDAVFADDEGWAQFSTTTRKARL